MHKVAQAFLTHRYEDSSSSSGQGLYSPGGPSKNVKPMRTIEVKTKRGQPIMVLQSEDTPLAIERTLKENGWAIVSWSGDNIQLAAVAILQVQAGNQQQAAKTGATPSGKAGAIGCLVLIAVVVLFASCAAAVSSNSKNTPKVGDAISAQVMCEQFIERELNAPSTAKFSQQEETQGQTTNEWLASGFVESENRLGGIVGHHYVCNLTYFPDTDKWSSDTKIL